MKFFTSRLNNFYLGDVSGLMFVEEVTMHAGSVLEGEGRRPDFYK